MKKITLFFAVALTSVLGFSQTVIIDRPNDNGTGLIATEGNDGTGVYCADQFEVTSEIAVSEILVYGFSSSGLDLTPLVTGFNVYIFEDFSGEPGGNPEVGGALYDLSDLAPGTFSIANDGGNQNDFSVSDMTAANGGDQVVLDPGTYWFCAFPTVDTPPTDAGRWNWTGSLSTEPAVQPVLIDPADLFGAGATNWTNISGLIAADFPAFGWQLIDEPVLGTEDQLAEAISIYPNPAVDVLNVRMPSNIQINNAAMYDVLGKKINVTVNNGQINISDLSSGVYVLELNTNEGSLSQKVIKK
ncbi:MAG: hypothetical protein CL596_02355 [Alteromonas sp.]|nr:hypothetical protein [Alteromonas sp.]MAY23305.1 hypothetical protein [Flavobacteriaceae bacterium]|tara:strand:- start:15670 stop:16572 length:903 start_codon:yes stop_codon:yes gene_type:complete